MKKLFNFILATMIGFSFLTSCTDDDGDPNIALDPRTGYVSQDDTLGIGETFKVYVIASEDATSNNKLTRFKITTDLETNALVDSTLPAGITSFTWDGTLIANTSATVETFYFKIEDEGGNYASTSFVITTEDVSVAVTKNQGLQLGDKDCVNCGSFYNSSANMIYTQGEVDGNPATQSVVDFLFIDNDTKQGSTIGAPTDTEIQAEFTNIANWTNVNATLFYPLVSITVAEFDAIGSTHIFSNYDTSNPASQYESIAVGNVILFKTVDEKFGLIKVTILDDANIVDYINFEVIVQN